MAIILNGTGSGFNRSVINDNFQKIEDELNNNVLRREAFGSEDNAMRIDLDMNSNRILNLPKPEGAFEPVRLIDFQSLIGGINLTPDASEVSFDGDVDYFASNVEQALVLEAALRANVDDNLRLVEDNVSVNNMQIVNIDSDVTRLQNEMLVVQNRSLTNSVDVASLSAAKANKDQDAVIGNIAVFDADGDPVDSGVALNLRSITTAELIANNFSPSEGDVITTTGFLTSGDGGEGSWVATSTIGLLPSKYPEDRETAELVDAGGRLWIPVGDVVDIKMLGAQGGQDCTGVFTAAYNWWSSERGRELVISSDTEPYIDQGDHLVDLEFKRFNKISGNGQVQHTGSGTCLEIRGAESSDISFNLFGGGVTGDFSVRDTDGSTFLRVAGNRSMRLEIDAISYVGRVCHSTAWDDVDPFARSVTMDIDIKTSSRNGWGADYNRCGQAIFADSASNIQTGGWGKISLRTEGTTYGPVFERLNDVEIETMEIGECLESGVEFRGVQVMNASRIYVGETDVVGSDDVGMLFTVDSEGRKCGSISIDQLKLLRNTVGVRFEDMSVAFPNVRVNHLEAIEGVDTLLEIHNCPSISIGNIGGGMNIGSLVSITGSNGTIDLNLSETYQLSGDAISINGSGDDKIRIRGSLTDVGASGFSLINVGNINPVIHLDNLIISSDTYDQLINMQFIGSNRIRHIGGSVGGTSPAYTPGGRRPEIISNVRGIQTKSHGTATIASGSTIAIVNTGIEVGIQYANAVGVSSPEVANVYLSAITGEAVTFAVPTAVTANRTIYWTADAEILRGDVDA